jgi:hypothetical protein
MNIAIFNWPRPLWKGEYEVVKRSGRGEPMWVVNTHVHEGNAKNLSVLLSFSQLTKVLCLIVAHVSCQQNRRKRE